VVRLPDGDAEGARGEPPEPRRGATVPRTAAKPRPAESGAANSAAAAGGPGPGTARRSSAAKSDTAGGHQPAPARGHATAKSGRGEALTAEGAARLHAELDQLIQVRRPDVIARIRTAKEHGDLRENAEYHAAREEQSFLEGRIQALEGRLRSAVIVDAPADGARVGLGSRVTIEADGETVSYTIVGASDSDPAAGRISSASPVGRALVGRDVGDSIVVHTPAGDRHYRIIEVS
jgi:transcription elongation factor GreA